LKKIIYGLTFLLSLLFAVPVYAYTAGDGDTMSEIAVEHGLTLEELAEANPQIKDLDLIYEGQTINTTINKEANTPTAETLIEKLSYKNIRLLESNVPPSASDHEEALPPKPESTTAASQIQKSTQASIKQAAEPKSSDNHIKLSKSDIDLLAKIVRAEANTEPFEGQVAVAAVVLNRMESPKFPNTVRDVIYQPGQFQPVANGQINKAADEDAYDAVYAALSEHRDIVQDSVFFYNPKIATSRWLDSRSTTAVIGQHVFKN
jgi:N-acetylmuramoyl-L-alanine amidase